jgi:FkbM family methyltransferase
MKITHLIYSVFCFSYKILPFKKQFCFLLKSTGISLPKKVYRELAFNGSFKTSIYGVNFKLNNYAFSHHIPENDIFWLNDKAWEPVTMKLWIGLAKNATVVFDIGANSGIFSIVAAAVNRDIQIYSFEPIARTFNCFQQNIQLNGFTNIVAEQMALSDKNGEVKIFDMGDDLPLNATLSDTFHKDEPNRISYNVKTQRLDTFIRSHNILHIDIMKIDVETYEYYVLNGMGEYLKDFCPTIIIEIFAEEQWTKVYPILKDIYTVFYIDEDNLKLREVTSYNDIRLYNFLLLSESNVSLVKNTFPELF